MEQHPVPQNVTTFQFRLIGDMTLKQFGYLVGGAILAYIIYKLPLPFFFTWPLAVLSAVFGFGLAFVPIEERPMDVWVLSFFKSIYSPTQYVWSKTAPQPQPPAAQSSAATPVVKPAPSTRKRSILQNIFLPSATQTMMPARIMDFSPPPVVKPTASVVQPPADTEDKVKKMQAQLTDLLSQREKMNQELSALRTQNSVPQTEPRVTTTTQTPKNPTIQIIQPGQAVKVGLPRLTTFSNVVTGIVKDKDKNLLPGVIVTVKDKDGIPLRALKTNRLGQFAASTQLPNGVYFVETEDPRLRYIFDRAQITLNGTVVPALEIFAKTEKEITRAKLEKELFGKPT